MNSQPQAGGASTSPPRPAVPPLTPFPRTLRDALGNALVIPALPQRIVSQTLGTDEILFAISSGLTHRRHQHAGADETYSNVLAQARASGAPAILGAEQVLRLKADLIFVASYSRAEIIEVLRASHAPIYRFANFDRLDDVKTNMRLVGRAIGEDAAAEALVTAMERRLAALAARVKPGPRPVVMSYSGDGYTAGANTLFDDEIRAAGGVNATAITVSTASRASAPSSCCNGIPTSSSPAPSRGRSRRCAITCCRIRPWPRPARGAAAAS